MGSGRQLFVYWRCASADREAALAETRAMQDRLRDRAPGLRTRVYLRCETESVDTATVMETYAAAGGVDGTTQQLIEREAEALRARWCRGARHVEVFEPADG